MQFVVYNVAKVELDSTSATFAHNFAKVKPCVQAFSPSHGHHQRYVAGTFKTAEWKDNTTFKNI